MKQLGIILIVAALGAQDTLAQAGDRNAQLKKWLERFPEADANKDGTLTMEEARAFQRARRARQLNRQKKPQPKTVPTTHADVAYGPHERHRLDLWLAKSDNPTPLLICIHGGGFKGGDKRKYHTAGGQIEKMRAAGVSVAAINYRLTEGGKHPYPAAMRDGARAIQFLRAHATKYNLDKTRFAATGGSAGACMSMWLGFHEDLADPDAEDPILRESTRLTAIAPNAGQPTLHLDTFEEWFGKKPLKEHPAFRPLFGIMQKGGKIEITPELDALMTNASPITHLTKDDPPCFMVYGGGDVEVTPESSPGLWVHHPRLGIHLKEAMDQLGLEAHVQYKGGPRPEGYADQDAFLIRKLSGK